MARPLKPKLPSDPEVALMCWTAPEESRKTRVTCAPAATESGLSAVKVCPAISPDARAGPLDCPRPGPVADSRQARDNRMGETRRRGATRGAPVRERGVFIQRIPPAPVSGLSSRLSGPLRSFPVPFSPLSRASILCRMARARRSASAREVR